ncbi:type IV secretion system protein [Allofrancisella guangzhouensis]|uniref:type IV secretion system protein n=1 Tax=Allofrancisella guangzhouensis TaxID=594679 RepID=UPI001903FF86|nr:type IV secretion system protein [Allofrancisella guangzhouensis]MBK2046054.1 type IV secretion system protein [Allofrancisella guangzhouensis]
MKEKIKLFMQKLKDMFKSKPKAKKNTKQKPEKPVKAQDSNKMNYFERAKTWADEIFTNAEVSKRQWFFAFSVSAFMNVLLVLAIVMMMPLKTTQLAIVHETQNGKWDYVTIHDSNQVSQSWAQSQSDISRYIRIREGYEPHNVLADNEYVKLLSSQTVYKEYIEEQEERESYLNTLGKTGYARVKIIDITRLSEKSDDGISKKINQAIVVFDVTVHTISKNKTFRFTANVGWEYEPISDETKMTKEQLLNNPYNFKVTNFQITKFENK